MDLELLPLLHVQRELYAMPRNMDRFHEYLKTMKGSSEDDIELAPLVLMNPMGKEHCLMAVDHLIAIGAEGAAVQALDEARPRLGDAPGAFKVSLVLADDRMGGWTNRTFSGFGMRHLAKDAKKALEKRPFITVPCWTSEVDAWTADDARRATLAQVYRVAHIMQHGDPKTLRQMMTQEARALVFAGETVITLPEDELAYAREVIAPHLEATDQPTVFACLFGDEAAGEAGYPQMGLPRNAAIEVALAEALGLSASAAYKRTS
jgi:hypothetical protein